MLTVCNTFSDDATVLFGIPCTVTIEPGSFSSGVITVIGSVFSGAATDLVSFSPGVAPELGSVSSGAAT